MYAGIGCTEVTSNVSVSHESVCKSNGDTYLVYGGAVETVCEDWSHIGRQT
jgi:hypothetical protein